MLVQASQVKYTDMVSPASARIIVGLVVEPVTVRIGKGGCKWQLRRKARSWRSG